MNWYKMAQDMGEGAYQSLSDYSDLMEEEEASAAYESSNIQTVYDKETGAKIDITKLTSRNIKNFIESGNFSDEDLIKLEEELVQRDVALAEALKDLRDEDRMFGDSE